MAGSVELDGPPQKLQILAGGGFLGRHAVIVQRGYDQGRQDPDDGGHDHQLGDGKRFSHFSGCPEPVPGRTCGSIEFTLLPAARRVGGEPTPLCLVVYRLHIAPTLSGSGYRTVRKEDALAAAGKTFGTPRRMGNTAS